MFAKIRKALTAGASVAVATFVAAVQAGQDASWPLVASALGAGVVAGAATWWVPNKPA